MPRIALYSRVSDDKLKEDGLRRQDIKRQEDHLMPTVRLWLSQNPDWELAGVYSDDGKSAFKEDYQSRPQFVRLLNDVKRHHVQRIYVESLDRWSRRVCDGLTTLKEVSEAGCTVVSMAEGEIDWTAPQGWFKSLIALGIAEWASREKSWRVTQAMDRRRNDARMICKACGIVHLGRHPGSCGCLKCLEKRKRLGVIR